LSDKEIYVTRPFLPPLEEFYPYLEKIWQNKILTNFGPMHQEFEASLCDYLCVDNVSLVSNGTMGLLLGIRALDIQGEVITTPYTFVATSNSLLWNNLKPVFVDIDETSLNLDAGKIESAITENTSAILPVHIYGNPCDFEEIQAIADKHSLKVIYDGAHAFGVSDTRGSILRHGDISVVSFHATKLFNTFEGGAVVCRNSALKTKIDELNNFGLNNKGQDVYSIGLNAKMNEVSAAFGLLQLKYIDQLIDDRERIAARYAAVMAGIPGLNPVPRKSGYKHNFSYIPVLVEDDYPLTRDKLFEKFQKHKIFTRKYFAPNINQYEAYRKIGYEAEKSNLIANPISEKILCLPIYSGMTYGEMERIFEILVDI
jgi:dTDP-4-amino-4,6-dideoxygalactose transaminase